MKYRIIQLLILVVLLVSCSTAPELKRDHANDPKSKTFMPNVGDLVVSIDSTKNVTLKWNDLSELEDGFIIQKSYDNKTDFFDLDTLGANITKYIDSTKKLSVNTSYRVRSFAHGSDSLGSTKIDQINFNALQSMSVPDVTRNELNISWVANKTTGYADAYLIEKRIKNGEWVGIDTVDNSYSEFSYRETEPIFSIDIRITPVLVNYLSEIELMEVFEPLESYKIALNLPSDLHVEFLTEAKARFSWKDNTAFNDEFVIVQRPGAWNSTPGNTDYLAVDTVTGTTAELFLNYQGYHVYDFNIHPVFKQENGKTITPVVKKLLQTQPTISSLNSLSSTEANINWSDGNTANGGDQFPTYNFTVELLDENQELIKQETLPKNQLSYSLSGLDSSNNYTFRVRSYSSEFSSLDFKYSSILSVKRSFKDTDLSNRIIYESPSKNFFLETNSQGTNLRNTSTGAIERTIAKKEDFDLYSFRVSLDETLYAAIINLDNKEIRVYSTESDKNEILYSKEIHNRDKFEFIDNNHILVYESRSTQFDTPNIRIINLTSTEIEKIPFPFDNIILFEAYLSKSGSKVYFRTGPTIELSIFELDLATKEFKNIIPNIKELRFIDSDLAGNILVQKEAYGDFYLYNKNGELISRFSPPAFSSSYLHFFRGLIGGENYVIISSTDGFVHLYDKLTGKYISSYRFYEDKFYDYVYHLSYSSKNGTIYAAFKNGDSRILEIESKWGLKRD